MKKELLKFLCTSLFALVCMSVNATVYSGDCGDDTGTGSLSDVKWYFNSATGTLTIMPVYYQGTGDEKAIKEYSTDNPNAYPWWTAHANDVTSIVIGEGITNIPAWAFAMMEHCTSVSLPSTLISIGNSALEECAFTSINLPEGLTTIGDYALQGGVFSSVIIPSTVTYIGDVAFQNNNNLTTVTCLNPDPTSITFSSNAFQDCDNLTAIYVPAGSVEDYITEWSDYSGIIKPIAATTTTFTYQATAKVDAFDTFANFSGATGVESHGFTGGTGTVVYNGTVTGITNYALCGATFTSLTIPNSVVWIGEGALEGCDQLTSLTIPNSVTHIGVMSIEGCTALATLSFPSSVKFIGEMAFENIAISSLSIPNGVTAICKQAFDACTSLETVTITNSVVVISDQAFQGCTSLATLTIGNSVTAIGTMAFDDCDALTTLSIPGSVEIIGEAAFSECSNLATVTLGKGVTVLDQSCFGDCAALTTINIPSTVTTITDAFPGSNNMEAIYCFADPSVTWTVGATDNFKTDGSTKCYVDDASAWSGSTLNLTFDDSSKPLEGTVVENECWATFYDADIDYAVDANTTVYKASLSGTTVTTTPIGGNQIITAGKAVILKSTGIPVLTATETASDGDFDGNALLGSDGVASDGNSYYALANGTQGLGFYKVGNGTVIPAGKAYLYTGGSGSNFYGIDLDDNTTVIKNMKIGKDSNVYYDLSGRRVLYPKKGLFIMNGKKVIFK